MLCTQRCPECPSRNLLPGQKEKPVVSGDWSWERGGILFVGEAPGREENNRHRVFVGKTGEEFNNTYLPLARLSRSDVAMTNTVKCHWADASDAPPESLVKSCSEFHLRRELAEHKPSVVVLMGGTANSLLGLDVELEHGMGQVQTLLGWTGKVFSTFHPALGLHKSDKMLAMVAKLDGDFPRLKHYLRGTLPEFPPTLATKFERLKDAKRVRKIMLQGLGDDCDIAVDTESKKSWRGYAATIRYTPWCVSFCVRPGEAYMVRMVDEAAFGEFRALINRFRRIIFHNAPYDHEILRVSGCVVDWNRTHDTMQMAFDDGRVPKGLKPLSYRLRGVRMISFDEVVVPHSRQRVVDYIENMMSIQWPKPVQELTGDVLEKKCPECKGTTVTSLGRGKYKKLYPCDCDGGVVIVPKMTRKQSLNEKLNRLATDMKKNPHGIDLWARWNGWAEKDPLGVGCVIEDIGPPPLPSIEYVPEGEAVDYACGDAHETLLNFPILNCRLIDLRRSIRV